MFQYAQTKICPRGQNVSILPYCILLGYFCKAKTSATKVIHALMMILERFYLLKLHIFWK